MVNHWKYIQASWCIWFCPGLSLMNLMHTEVSEEFTIPYDVLWSVWNVWGVDLSGVRICQRLSVGCLGPRARDTWNVPPITSRPAQAPGNPNKQLLRLKDFDQTLSGVWMGCKRWQWLGWIVCLPPSTVAFQSPGYNYLCLDRTSPLPPPPYQREQTRVRVCHLVTGRVHLW